MRYELKHTATFLKDDATKNYHKTFELKDSATKAQARSLAVNYENFLQNPSDHSADFVSYDAIDLD